MPMRYSMTIAIYPYVSGVVAVFAMIGWRAIVVFNDHRNLPFCMFTVL